MRMQVVVIAALLAGATAAQAADKQPYKVKGLFVETCSCHAPCGCEMVGLKSGCLGVGAMTISAGSYHGQDLAGVKAAYAGAPGDWMRIYIQADSPEKRKAAEAFLTAVYSAWGKIDAVKDAKIDITGDYGKYTVTVDAGKIMKYETEVVLGGDKKTAVTHQNVADPLNTTFKQALGVSCEFKDEARSFTLEKGRNAFFNDTMSAEGEI
jgi:hypothetical protein